MDRAVANRYVSALTEVVCSADSRLSPDSALMQLETFSGLLDGSPDLKQALSSPAVRAGDKRSLIREIGGRVGLDSLVVNFLCVVADHRRMGHFSVLVNQFRVWLDRHLGRVALEVRLAGPVSDSEKKALEARFREVTGAQVRAVYVEDPEILGGCSVQVGATLYDGSLRTALSSLGERLATGGQ